MTIKNRIVFIGDSIVQEMPIGQITPNGENYGIAGDTTKGVIDRLDTISILNNACAIVIHIGINDFWFYGKDKIIDYYKILLDIIPKNTVTVVNSILPIDEEYETLPYNHVIDEVNQRIEDLCQNHKNLHYCDSNSRMKNSAGYLEQEFHIGDGLHLSELGYLMLMQSIATKLNRVVPKGCIVNTPQ